MKAGWVALGLYLIVTGFCWYAPAADLPVVPAPPALGSVTLPPPCSECLERPDEVHVNGCIYVLDGYPPGQRGAIANQLRWDAAHGRPLP